MAKFVPASFHPDRALIHWAVKEFNISKDEVLRQLDLMRDHEFRRSYTCWTRVFRNWLRKCEDIQGFKRERQYRQPQPLTDAQRTIDADKAIAQMSEYRQRG